MRFSYISTLSLAIACTALVACGDDEQTTTDQTTSGSTTTGSSTTDVSTTTSTSATTENPTTGTTGPSPTTSESSSSGPPPPVCGDGNVDPGEECDDANADDTDACTSACKNAVCGDGFVGPGEACDDANADNTDACTDQCAAASCGDGNLQAGAEECDDGNMDDTDACLSTCKNAICGDLAVQAGVEECDDGNMDDADACVTGCKNATCGDTFVQAGTEECDDGNMDDTDACVTGCKTAKCGDAFVQMGTETCDDGNMSNLDMCTNMCKAPACDDKIQSGTESDVDCGSMCMAKCADGKMCAKGTDCASGYCSMNKCALAISCQQIKTGNPMAADGIYSIDPDGMGMGAPIKVFCDMTTDGGGWTMVFKVSSGVAGDANTLWNGPAVNENDETLLNVAKSTKHYVSSYIANYWNKAGVVVTDVRAHAYKAAAIAKFWKYDGKMSTSINWYTNTKLTGSSYTDLPAGPFNFYSIVGDAAPGRRFYINRTYNGCPGDTGWLVLDGTADPCTWETNKNAAAIRILYAPGQTFINWETAVNTNTVGVGDVFAVFVR